MRMLSHHAVAECPPSSTLISPGGSGALAAADCGCLLTEPRTWIESRPLTYFPHAV